jgi:hypothetical protein
MMCQLQREALYIFLVVYSLSVYPAYGTFLRLQPILNTPMKRMGCEKRMVELLMQSFLSPICCRPRAHSGVRFVLTFIATIVFAQLHNSTLSQPAARNSQTMAGECN